VDKNDIIKMAKQAGLLPIDIGPTIETWQMRRKEESLVRFAALFAAAEREACAKLCDEKVDSEYATGKVDHNEMAWTQACAIAIRARGE
jgi:hypothetical protein